MKSKHTPAKKTAEEIKYISQHFFSPSKTSTRDDSSMDWSIHDTPSSPAPRASPASEHVASPQVPLANRDPSERSRVEHPSPFVLNYGNNQLSIATSWDGAYHALSIFRTQETSAIDATNITQSISRMIDYFKHNPAEEFAEVVKALWGLITMIYTSRWDLLPIEDKSIRKLVDEKIVPGCMKLGLANDKTAENPSLSSTSLPSNTAVPPPPPNPVPAPPPQASVVPQKVPKPSNMKKLYMQASKSNTSRVDDILRVKEAFPSLSADEVDKILKVKNGSESKKKPKLNMTTRGPSRKEVIIPMTKPNAELITKSAHKIIANINEHLKNSNSDVIADFIRLSNNKVIITTN